jgi:transposase
MHAQGESIHAIAHHVGIARQTVRRFLSADQFPERATRRQRPSKLDPHIPCLEAQLRAGQMNGTTLWRLIRDEEGYSGSRALVSRWVRQHRHLLPASMHTLPPPRGRGRQAPWPVVPPPPRVLSARQAAWLFIRPVDALPADERVVVEHLLQVSPALAVAHELVHAFIDIVRTRAAALFDGWLAQAASSGVGELERFVSALVRDYAAVFAALSLPYSNGPVEGHVNRLKFIKRMGYGRAKFDLLRQRVLAG